MDLSTPTSSELDPQVRANPWVRADEPASILVVSSPKAGCGRGRDEILRLVGLLQQSGADVVCTASIQDYESQLGRRLDRSDRAIVVVSAGGDGTLSLVARHTPSHVPIVPMPLGTENLLARHFGFTSRADDVIATIVRGQPTQIDAGSVRGSQSGRRVAQLFLVVASAGFDAEVVRGMHLTRRGHISRWSYTRPIARALWRYTFPEIQIRIDGQLLEGPPLKWAMLFNLPRYAAGLAIEPDAVGDDGQLDLIGFSRGDVASGLRYTGGILLGKHRSWNDVVRLRGRHFELWSSRRVPYQLDGDYVGRLPLEIETLPGRVRLLLPDNVKRPIAVTSGA